MNLILPPYFQSLVDAVLPLAKQSIERDGLMNPFGAVLDIFGSIIHISGYIPSEYIGSENACSIVDVRIREALPQKNIEAVALVAHANMDSASETVGTIGCHLERRNGDALFVGFSYVVRMKRRAFGLGCATRNVAYGEVTKSVAKPSILGKSDVSAAR